MKKLIKVLPVMLALMFALTNIFAVGIPNSEDLKGNEINKVTGVAKNVWSTVTTIVQILAVAAVVFAGLRYMFASADQKADIKKSMGILAVGAILVFAATTILSFLSNVANTALK